MEVILIIGFITMHFREILGVIAIICIFLIVIGMIRASSSDDKESVMNYLEASDDLISALDSQSIEKVKSCIDHLDYEYNKVRHIDGGNYLYNNDRTALVEHLHELEQADWESKANPYLQEFFDYYNMIVGGDFRNFRDVEMLFQAKDHCIDMWQSYFHVDLDDYETTIYPKRHMREWLGEDYDPCMESHAALEKKLSACVDTMRPEYVRKAALYDLIVDHVASKGTVARSDLLKTEFSGFIPEEVRCCYRALIKSNRLAAIKMGNQYFVSLSDSEVARRHNQSTKGEQMMIASSDKLVHDAIIKHLMDEGAEYVDMTHKGGGLYFFSQSIAEDLKKKGYNIGYAENGSRSTSGRPAWYLKE